MQRQRWRGGRAGALPRVQRALRAPARAVPSRTHRPLAGLSRKPPKHAQRAAAAPQNIGPPPAPTRARPPAAPHRDVTATAAFYKSVLGFKVVKRPSAFNFEGCWVRAAAGRASSCCELDAGTISHRPSHCVPSTTPPPAYTRAAARVRRGPAPDQGPHRRARAAQAHRPQVGPCKCARQGLTWGLENWDWVAFHHPPKTLGCPPAASRVRGWVRAWAVRRRGRGLRLCVGAGVGVGSLRP